MWPFTVVLWSRTIVLVLHVPELPHPVVVPLGSVRGEA